MFRNSGISREVKEMIAVTVSRLNGCEYCVKHHAEALNYYWKDPEKLSEFVKREDAVSLPDQMKALFLYVEKLTVHPDRIKEDDVRKLRQADYNDEEILEINLIVSYFNFVNRIASGLGVEFTEEEMSGFRY
jgi:uncharacterized peroxidase-related enzyme